MRRGRRRAKRAPGPDWEPPVPGLRRRLDTWDDYMAMAERIVGRFHDRFELRHFGYVQPVHLQRKSPSRFIKPYEVQVAYSDWGGAGKPLLLCLGGVANTAMRFNYLAADLMDRFRVVCMDWVGRGRSGWLADQREYSLDTYVEQIRQLVEYLGVGSVTVLGSSMGGSAAIEYAARHRKRVERLILNDVGPWIPRQRRARRAQTIARHYVFSNPADLLRKVGASQKADGPISDDIRFNMTFHQTRWSEEEKGRVYRHDVRALQAYRDEARQSLDQWASWARVKCPVLVIHGLLSDALLPHTLARMRRAHEITVMHVPDTGHTPVLSDRNQTWFIYQWLCDTGVAAGEWTTLHAVARDETAPAPQGVAEPVHGN